MLIGASVWHLHTAPLYHTAPQRRTGTRTALRIAAPCATKMANVGCGGSCFTKGRTGPCGLIGATSVDYFGVAAQGHVCMSVNFIQVWPLGHLIHISITTPIARALKNCSSWGFLEVPTEILSHFRIQMAVSEVKRPLHGGFGSETVKKINGYM